MVRDEDITGISGTGKIAAGALFADGTAVLHWPGDPYTTTTVHPGGLESILHIHGHGGKTRIVWDDEQPAPGFAEEDIEFLHTILAREVDAKLYGRARVLLQKIRAAMATVPAQKSVP